MTGEDKHTCDVWDLARRGGARRGRLALADASRLAESLLDRHGAIDFGLHGSIDRRGRPAARLELHGTVTLRCDRCGRPVEVPIDETADFFFVADEAELGRLPIDESPDEPLLGSTRFDLAALVEDQVILSLPLSPRHRDCVAVEATDDDGAAEPAETHRPFATLARLTGRKP